MERYYIIEFDKWIEKLNDDKTLKTKKPKARTVLLITYFVIGGCLMLSVFWWNSFIGVLIGALLFVALLVMSLIMMKYEQSLINKDNYAYLKQDEYKDYCKKIADKFENDFKVKKAEHFEMILGAAEETREKIYSSSLTPLKLCEKLIYGISLPLISIILTKILDISFELRKSTPNSESGVSDLQNVIQSQINNLQNSLTKVVAFFVVLMIIIACLAYLASKGVSRELKQYDRFIYYLKGIVEAKKFNCEKDDNNTDEQGS